MGETNTVGLSGSSNKFKLVTDESNPNRPMLIVQMLDENDAELGSFARAWFQDGRLVADLPGVDGAHFHVQSGDDHIEING